MKKNIKIKLGFFVFIAFLFLLIISQNSSFFLAKQAISINILIIKYTTSPLPIAALFIVIFILGYLIAYLLTLIEKIKNRKTIKALSDTVNSSLESITALESEVEDLKKTKSGKSEKFESDVDD
ncbi:MAG: DUF1049 domain-containing protein [Desulfobacterales bacterium]|nr:DUF1049 domain-containing protein [Desulfobacterales bacterium]